MTPHEKILEALVEELRSLQELHEYEVGSEDAALAVSRARLNEILAKYELVPIDSTPFDPERCGFIQGNNMNAREKSKNTFWLAVILLIAAILFGPTICMQVMYPQIVEQNP